jgi:hypothetical protein
MLHRCRWHPANHSLVFQRPARRRSSVCSACSPHRLAKAKRCLLAFQLSSGTEAPSKNLLAKNQACFILPANSPKCAHRPARTLKALQRRCRLAALFHPHAENMLALDCSPCRTADPLGVCDVKDRVGSPPKLLTRVTMNRLLNTVRSFSWKRGINDFPLRGRTRFSALFPRFIPGGTAYKLARAIPSARSPSLLRPCSAPNWRCLNINRLSIGFAFRLYLRGRLTLPG